jgi:hypothetical protein
MKAGLPFIFKRLQNGMKYCQTVFAAMDWQVPECLFFTQEVLQRKCALSVFRLKTE